MSGSHLQDYGYPLSSAENLPVSKDLVHQKSGGFPLWRLEFTVPERPREETTSFQNPFVSP